MILIADGGSTKVDWVLLNEKKEPTNTFKSLGLNPSIADSVEIVKRIIAANDLYAIRNKITEIYFYGAGCGTEKSSNSLKKTFSTVFNNASIVVKEDTYAAVYACSPKEQGLICIIGTGSNSCYFDGKKVFNNTPSLGYTLMDEGSGNYLGKILLQDYYYKRMPKELREQFSSEFDLEIDVVKKNLYKNEKPNQYLASFAKFLPDHSDTIYVREIIEKGFTEFVNNRVLNYPESKIHKIHFVGSIAYYYKDILINVLEKNSLIPGNIIQKPISKLIEYHQLN